MNRLLKYLVTLNGILALVSLFGGAWVARTSGSQAYVSCAVAGGVVGLAASLALLVTFLQVRMASVSKANQAPEQNSNQNSAVSGVLLAMLIRMGLPIAVMIVMQQIQSPLLEAGFLGLLTLNYLVALPLETAMSLSVLRDFEVEKPGSDVTAGSPGGSSSAVSV